MSFTKLVGNGRSNGYVSTTVALGATESSAVDIMGFANVGLLLASGIDEGGTGISFKASNLSDGTFYTIENTSGTAFTIASGVNNCAIECDDLAPLAGYRYVKIVCSTAQTSDRVFVWCLKA